MGPRSRDDSWKVRANAAMERYAEGSADAFEELYELVAPRLHAFLVRRTRDPCRAEDLVHDTFVRVHKSRCHFAAGTDVMTWAFTIARRLFIDEYRKERDAVDFERPAPEPPDALAARMRLGKKIMEELARLPEANREAFELVQIDGLSMAQAATVLGVSETAVKLRAFRTYKALREKLGEQVREELEVQS